jgi:diguanylate cyclase (GGDEF)-like protein
VTFPIPARGALEAVTRARDVRRSLGVRLAAALFVGAGVLAFVAIPTLPSATAAWITAGIGAVALALGWLTAAAPWDRWRPGTSFWLAPVALALIALANGVGSHEAYDYAAFYVIVHAWVGISQPRHASLWLAPLTAVAFLAPLVWIATDPATAAWSVLVAVPASVLVGEGIAWLVAQLDASDRSLSDLSNIVTELEFTALHDVVTGLPNRAAFYEHIEVAIARARRSNERLIVCSLDLDKFKLVNDTLGHAAGDTLLEEMAARLRGILREGDVVARVGGDEFLMLLPASRPPDEVAALDSETAGEEAAIATRIRDALEPPVRLRDTDVYVSASVGTAVFPTDATDIDALLRVADAKMYRSKRGRSAIGVIEDRDATAELELTSRLRASAKSQPWELHFQPIVELVTGRTVGAEALVRWNDPSHGLRTASEFLGLAEELDLGDDLTRWVIEELGDVASSWHEDGVLDALTMITVNVSPRGLWQPGLTDRLRNVAECLGRRDLLVVEVTEAALSMDAARARDVLLTLREDGMLIALDDFGTGYSSLARLRALPIDVLKIDRSFLDGLIGDAEARRVLRSIVRLAAGLGMVAVAEGVEDREQLDAVVDEGCTLAQGYHLGRAMAAERFAARVLESNREVVSARR